MLTISNNSRIAKNTLMLYIRMLFLMVVNLYTSRIVLDALGISDYGVYNAVGGFISMFSMISASLSTAISRFLTFVLGEGDEIKLKRVFSNSVIIQLALAIIVVVLIESVGVWFLNSHMTIPKGRETATNWVLQFSLITFVINLLSVPYNASLIAHERMGVFAYIGIFEGCANLGIAFLIMGAPIDSLIFYSILMALVAIITRMLYTFYCKRHFSECSFHWGIEKSLLKEMFSFAGWNFIGSISGLLRSQGINILFNVYNGPLVNAANGIAIQVNTALTKFSNSFYTAVQPQITKSYAAGNNKDSFELVLKSSRLAFFLLTILSLPVIFETDFLLSLWLKEVPKHTTTFVQIIVIYSLFESLSQPLIQLMLATGNIKKYQLLVGGLNLLNFPLAWVILYKGYSPELAQLTVIIFTFLALVVRIYMLQSMIGFPTVKFLKKTVLRCISISLLCCIGPMWISLNMGGGWERVLVNVILLGPVSLIIICILGLNANERQFVFRELMKRLK